MESQSEPHKDERHPWTKVFHRLLIMAGLGILISLYLVHEHYTSTSSICDISMTFSCSRVNKSRFSVLFGVPVAFWGILWNVMLAEISRKSLQVLEVNQLKDQELLRTYVFFLFVWCLAGIGFVVYFIIAEYLLHAMCIFCTMVHVLIVLAFAFVHQIFKSIRMFPEVVQMVKKMRKYILSLGVAAVLLILVFNFGLVHKAQGHSGLEHRKYDTLSFARCMTKNGFTMFGSMSCGHCVEQKEIIGPAWEFTKFVECQETDCESKNVTGFPTWIQIMDDKEIQRHEGLMSLDELSNFTKCDLESL